MDEIGDIEYIPGFLWNDRWAVRVSPSTQLLFKTHDDARIFSVLIKLTEILKGVIK